MRAIPLLAASLLLTALPAAPGLAGEPDPAAALVAPLKAGSPLPGDYTLIGLGPSTASCIKVTIEGHGNAVDVKFMKRCGKSPAFTRTPRCNVIYETGGPSGIETPEPLALAVRHLAGKAALHDDACDGLDQATVPAPGAVPSGGLPWGLLSLTFLGAALFGLFARLASPRVPPAWRNILFFAGVVLMTGIGAFLRTRTMGAPFCEGAFTQRIELGAQPLWKLLAMLSTDYRHPPMTALIIHFTLWLGSSEAVLRLPFAILSSLSVPAIALLGRRMGGDLAGLCAGLVCALMGPLVDIGGQICSHALFFFVAPLTLLAYDNLLGRPTRGNLIALAAMNVLAIWTHYICIILIVLQLFDLLALKRGAPREGPPGSRIGAAIHRFPRFFLPCVEGAGKEAASQLGLLGKQLARSLWLTLIGGAIPLAHLLWGLARDTQVRSIAEKAPDELWGAKTSVIVLREALFLIDPRVAALLALFALLGTVEIVARCASPARSRADRAGLHVALLAWLIPAAILALTPLNRMRGFYMALALPFLVPVAARGAAALPRMLLLRAPARLRGLAGDALGWGLASLLAFVPSWHSLAFALPATEEQAHSCVYPEIAEAIRAGSARTVVLVHGYSRSLLGYYLAGKRVEPTAFKEKDRASPLYGGYTVVTLCDIEDLKGDWRPKAQERLRRIIARQGKAWLVDMRHVETTWPALEQARSCTVHKTYPEARLLSCGGGAQSLSRYLKDTFTRAR